MKGYEIPTEPLEANSDAVARCEQLREELRAMDGRSAAINKRLREIPGEIVELQKAINRGRADETDLDELVAERVRLESRLLGMNQARAHIRGKIHDFYPAVRAKADAIVRAAGDVLDRYLIDLAGRVDRELDEILGPLNSLTGEAAPGRHIQHVVWTELWQHRAIREALHTARFRPSNPGTTTRLPDGRQVPLDSSEGASNQRRLMIEAENRRGDAPPPRSDVGVTNGW